MKGRKEDKDDSVLLCDRCDYEVVPKEKEEEHKILKQDSLEAPSVVKQNTFKCDDCHKAFFSVNSLMEHTIFSHEIKCSHCFGGFKPKVELLSHTQKELNFGCDLCRRNFF